MKPHIMLASKLILLIVFAFFTVTTAHAQTAAAKPAAKPHAQHQQHHHAGPPAADDNQVALAGNVHTGRIECELGQHVDVQPSQHAGYISLTHAGHTYEMKPVLSSTGAIRLEDVKGAAMLLQLGNKSMLMNKHTGRRLVDGCEHAKQKEAMQAHERAKAEGRVTSVLQ